MNVLVTGGTGFIGGHVLRQLLKRGHAPVAFDVITDTSAISDILDRVTIVRGEVQDLPLLTETVKNHNVTHIVHMASLLTATSQKRPWAAMQVNILGTVNVLETARILGVSQIVYMSSTAVYGYTKEGEVIDEEYEQKPVTIYGATKLLCEHYGLNYRHDYGLGFIALRFPIVYGPGQSYRGFSSFKEIVEKPVAGLPAIVPYGGDHKYDGVYVKDVSNAIVTACFADRTEHNIFNIGTGVMWTLRDLAEVVRRKIPKAVFEIGPGMDVAEPVKGPLSIERARKELRYEPRFDLEAGVADYISTLKGMAAWAN